jgi:hypothetical protein
LVTSPDTKRWTAAIGRRLRAIVTRGRLATSHPPVHRLHAPRADSNDSWNKQQNKSDASTESVEAAHDWLPIGPSCC